MATTLTTHTFTVTAVEAPGPGALSGHAMRCTCGTVLTTSLSARMAEVDGWKHLDWHTKTGL